MNRTGPSQKTIDLIEHRSRGVCERCGGAHATNIHHRRPRGMGGTRAVWINHPSNLLHLCGSATTGCHGWIEGNRTAAYEAGLLVRSPLDPASVPVTLRLGVMRRAVSVLLADDGEYVPIVEATA